MRKEVDKTKPNVIILLVLIGIGVIYAIFERFPGVYPSVIGLFLFVVIIYYAHTKQTKGKTKGKKPKLRLPKDEAARYKKLKELGEESKISHELWIKPLTEEEKKENKKEFRPFY